MCNNIILKILGLLLILFSTTMIPPAIVARYYMESTEYNSYFLTAIIAITIGLLLWCFNRRASGNIKLKQGFLIVTATWLIAALVSSLPFIISPHNISSIDALFEAMSGITATGSTVLVALDHLPRSLLYYRQQLQFLGGLGITLLAVAILPALGSGGMQLFRAEFAGSAKDNKLVPRIAQYAKGIWLIYLSLTVLCAICYWAFGMEWFDAIGYSFSTVSTGGFATHDNSIAYFQSNKILLISICFMLLSSLNFSLHFLSLARSRLKYYWRDIEFRSYCALIISAIIIIVLQSNNSLLESAYAVISIATTTGFINNSFSSWPSFMPFLLLMLGIIGGCGGSTSGGIKVIRIIFLYKIAIRELKRLLHPHAYYEITIQQHRIPYRTLDAISGFFILYIMIFIIISLLLLATGLDFPSAFSATAAAISNIGPGLGAVTQNFSELNNSAKLLLSFAMLIGRLEIFTALVLLMPGYWRR